MADLGYSLGNLNMSVSFPKESEGDIEYFSIDMMKK